VLSARPPSGADLPRGQLSAGRSALLQHGDRQQNLQKADFLLQHMWERKELKGTHWGVRAKKFIIAGHQ